jgi:hypothetical protein
LTHRRAGPCGGHTAHGQALEGSVARYRNCHSVLIANVGSIRRVCHSNHVLNQTAARPLHVATCRTCQLPPPHRPAVDLGPSSARSRPVYMYPTPPPSREQLPSRGGTSVGARPGSVPYPTPPPSRETLPDSIIDELWQKTLAENPGIPGIADLPDQALINVLLSHAATSDAVKEACERQLASRVSLKLRLTPAGADALLARVQCPRGARFVSRFAGLREIDVRNSVELGDEGLTVLAMALPATLAVLDIRSTACGDAGMIAVAQALPATNIRALVCSENVGIGIAGWTALGHTLNSLPYLRTLNCSSCGVMSRSAKEPREKWVERCSRDKTGMGDDGAIAIAAGLAGAASLESVYLDTCGIGDAGATALAAAMPDCPSLNRLFCFSNPIGQAGRSAFEAAIPQCPELTDTFKNKFSFEGQNYTLPKDQFYRENEPAQVVL